MGEHLIVGHALFWAQLGVHVGADDAREKVLAHDLVLLPRGKLGFNELLFCIDNRSGDAVGVVLNVANRALDLVRLKSALDSAEVTHKDAQRWDESCEDVHEAWLVTGFEHGGEGVGQRVVLRGESWDQQ